MNYTDKELIRASQIAYFTINYQVINDIIDWIEEGENHSNYTLSELYEHSSTFRDSIYNNISDVAGFPVTEFNESKNVLDWIKSDVTRQMVAEKYAIIDDIKTGKIGSWKVVSYVDNNNIFETGMAGKLVDGSWVHSNFSESGDGLAAMVFETGDRFTA